MTIELVDPNKIESIVGVERLDAWHIARWVTADDKIYILHSRQCKDSDIDLRECEYATAAPSQDFDLFPDTPVVVVIDYYERKLTPFRVAV